MYARQLVGRQAGQICEFPTDVAKAKIVDGTAKEVSEKEIREEGLNSAHQDVPVKPDQLLAGYRIEPADEGGFHLLDAGGVKVLKGDGDDATDTFHNHPEARAFALEHALKARHMAPPYDPEGERSGDKETGGDKYDGMTVPQLRVEADKRGISLVPGAKKSDIVSALDRDDKVSAVIVSGQFDAVSDDDLSAYAADHKIDLSGVRDRDGAVTAIKAARKPAA